MVGDPFQLMEYQQLGRFFNTAAYQTGLAVMLLAVKRLRTGYTAWYLAYFVAVIGATVAFFWFGALPPLKKRKRLRDRRGILVHYAER